MIAKHLYPIIIIAVMAVGMWGLWQQSRFINTQNKYLKERVEMLVTNQENVFNALDRKDRRDAKVNKRLLDTLESISNIPNDGCLDSTLPEQLFMGKKRTNNPS